MSKNSRRNQGPLSTPKNQPEKADSTVIIGGGEPKPDENEGSWDQVPTTQTGIENQDDSENHEANKPDLESQDENSEGKEDAPEALNTEAEGEDQKAPEEDTLEKSKEPTEDEQQPEEEEFSPDEGLLVLLGSMGVNPKELKGINVSKVIKDAWAIKKPGKPFPGMMTARQVLIKDLVISKK